VRVYLPTTARHLHALVDGSELVPPLTGFAVTPELREWYVDNDIEELEYAAMLEAARGSLRLLDEDRRAPRRRIVLAADVPDETVTLCPDLDRAAVRVAARVPLRLVVAIHADGPEAEPAVRAAAEAVLEADLGEEDAQFVVDEAEGHELLWYANQEIGSLLASI
jgi:hypothetical protein